MIQQLSLFAEPTIENVTIEWIYDFLTRNLPQLLWQYEEMIDGSKGIVQKKNKKISISVDIGKFSDTVTWVNSKKYIGINAQKNYGDYNGVGMPITSIEEFKEQIYKICEEYNGVNK